MPPYALLHNPVRHYPWGSPTAIPALTGSAPDGTPQAELWMGAHPCAPSRAAGRPLDALIAADPDGLLGPATVRRFGPALPFLFKVLAADRALSLQVHPTRAQAEAGYADEQARGIPPAAPERVFKDRSHKPELLCALGDFEALCGFRRPAGTARLLDALGVLAPWSATLRERPAAEALPVLLREALTAEAPRPADAPEPADAPRPADRRRLSEDPQLAAVTEALRRTAASDGPYAQTCAAYARLAEEYPGDRGLLAALLLNHVRLRAGQALYLDAGVPHAYLRGTGVELMANSDNVLRCGLTTKHVDVDGLLAVTSFRAAEPVLLTARPLSGVEAEFPSPAEEFRLSRLRPPVTPVRVELPTPQILLCVAGHARLHAPGHPGLDLPRGASAYLPPGAGPVELTGSGAELFRATTGR
ncbi:mannose-6-phosphate isomerase, class I [Streptomyces sp. CBMA123]|uniref:mannose-6-phosphate isomerase, class I n=1 Tax=Streptomyces sp. CBMA123 TaxID=1896313 RepID=UPI001661BD48|nr:mannose-6-phosphate isomerase, class I [Streptomyces sp. CBMA123]MBD0692319.1 mannose-6-phosphate isomerase, class I [Streptomyces sp. CBMA123]